MRRILCLPIEYFKREFETRCYIASEALRRGFSVAIGDWVDPSFFLFEDSIFILSQGFASSAHHLVESMEKNNNVVYFHDEEGLQHLINPKRFGLRIGSTALDLGHGHFAWSKSHADFLKSRGCSNVIITGSPKYDLVRKFANLNVDNLSKIKVYTRFTSANMKDLPGYLDTIDLQIKIGAIQNLEHLEEEKLYHYNDLKVFNEFLLLLRMLGEDGQFPVSIRVHHNESRKPYDNLAKCYDNIEVEDESVSLVDSLLEARFLILDGCTTSTEAKLLRGNTLPIFSLRPLTVGTYGSDILNSLADLNFHTAKDLFEFLRRPELFALGENVVRVDKLMSRIAMNTAEDVQFSRIVFGEFERLVWSRPSMFKSRYFSIHPILYEVKYFGILELLNGVKSNTNTLSQSEQNLKGSRKFPYVLSKHIVYNGIKRFYKDKMEDLSFVRLSKSLVLIEPRTDISSISS